MSENDVHNPSRRKFFSDLLRRPAQEIQEDPGEADASTNKSDRSIDAFLEKHRYFYLIYLCSHLPLQDLLVFPELASGGDLKRIFFLKGCEHHSLTYVLSISIILFVWLDSIEQLNSVYKNYSLCQKPP